MSLLQKMFHLLLQSLLLKELSDNHNGSNEIINKGEFAKNFAQVQIYYEELNFQSITENQNYAVSFNYNLSFRQLSYVLSA